MFLSFNDMKVVLRAIQAIKGDLLQKLNFL